MSLGALLVAFAGLYGAYVLGLLDFLKDLF